MNFYLVYEDNFFVESIDNYLVFFESFNIKVLVLFYVKLKIGEKVFRVGVDYLVVDFLMLEIGELVYLFII